MSIKPSEERVKGRRLDYALELIFEALELFKSSRVNTLVQMAGIKKIAICEEHVKPARPLEQSELCERYAPCFMHDALPQLEDS